MDEGLYAPGGWGDEIVEEARQWLERTRKGSMPNVIFQTQGNESDVILYEDGDLYVREGHDSATYSLTDEDKLNLIRALLK